MTKSDLPSSIRIQLHIVCDDLRIPHGIFTSQMGKDSTDDGGHTAGADVSVDAPGEMQGDVIADLDKMTKGMA